MVKVKTNTADIATRKLEIGEAIKILAGDIISTKEGVDTQIEHIHNGRVYMYQWEASPNNPIRITFPIETVIGYIKEGIWSCKNTFIEVSKSEAIFPGDTIFEEAIQSIKLGYENGNYVVLESDTMRRWHFIKIDNDTAIRSEDNTLKRSLDRRSFSVITMNHYNTVYNDVSCGDFSTYKPYIESDKKIFYTKSEVEKYYNTPSYDAIKWVD